MKRASAQLKMQLFTHSQKEEIYEFIKQAIEEFNEKYEAELSLLKNLSTNSKVVEFLIKLKRSSRSNKKEDKAMVLLKTKNKHISRNGVIRGNTLNSLSKKGELLLVSTNQIDKHHKIHSRNIEVMPQTVIMETVDNFQARNSMGFITSRTCNKKNDKYIPKTTLSKSNCQNSKSFVVKKGDEIENTRTSLLSKRKAPGKGQLYQTIPPKKSPITEAVKFRTKKELKQDSFLNNEASKKTIVKEGRLKTNRTILENSENKERKSFISKDNTIKKNYSKVLKITKKDSFLNETLDHHQSRQDPKRSFINSKSYKEYATLSTSNLQTRNEHDRNNMNLKHQRSTFKINNVTPIGKQGTTEFRNENKKDEVKEKALVTKKTNPKNLNKQIKTLQNTISKNNKPLKLSMTQTGKYSKSDIFNMAINEQLYQKDIKASVKIVEALSISDEIGSLVSSATVTKLKPEDDCLSHTTKPRLSDCTQTITADKLSKLPEMTLEEKKYLIDYSSKKSESKDLDKSGAEYSTLPSPLKVIVLIIE